ncbi:hypothetical protein L9F63_013620, partial [Diploptera punctata]
VVNGVKYILHLEISETDCLKGSGRAPSTCEVNENKPRICLVEFLEKPWIDSSREIISNNCTKYKNDLENEIEPHFVSNTHLTRDEIFDYLDAIADTDPVVDEEHRSYGKDGLYPPGNEPENHSTEEDAEKIDVKSFETEKPEVDDVGTTTGPAVESDESMESGENEQEMDKQDSDESEGSVSRSRRELGLRRNFGQLKEITETEKQLVDKLAQIAVNTLDEIDEDDKKRVILEIISAKKQLVRGILYHLKLRIVSTSCSEKGGSTPDCVNDQLSPVKICKIELLRSFASDSQLDAKVVKSECAAETEVVPGNNTRKRREIVRGGVFTADLDDPYIMEMANFGVSELDRGSNSLYRQCITRIMKASKQVVAGYNIYLTVEVQQSSHRKVHGEAAVNNTCEQSDNAETKICDIVIWHQPWIQNSQQVTSHNCSEVSREDNELPSNRRRRDILRSAISVELPDPMLTDLVTDELNKLNKRSNGLYNQKIVKILTASQQVVPRMCVNVTMEVKYCRKERNSDCELKKYSKNQICHFSICERDHLNSVRMLSESCSPTFNKVSMKKYKLSEEFESFMEKHNKTYSTHSEMKNRFRIFRQNMNKIYILQRTEEGTATYGVTRFADLSGTECINDHTDLQEENQIPMKEAIIPDVKLPNEFDWRHYNVVTEVKNQGMCGSCWAFSVTGNIEGQWAINRGELLSLSEQELVDCDTLDDGCDGGLPDRAYRAVEKLGGLETESDYPYEAEDDKCHFNKSEVKVSIQGSVNITTNETKIAQWLYKFGPVSIGINAYAMQFYTGGVSHPWKILCNPEQLDHGVLIVGFGVHKTSIFHRILPYWTIKNSWGPKWGEKGYYRVYRGDGTCGVNQMVTSAVVG